MIYIIYNSLNKKNRCTGPTFKAYFANTILHRLLQIFFSV